jgi:hypothetical protein
MGRSTVLGSKLQGIKLVVLIQSYKLPAHEAEPLRLSHSLARLPSLSVIDGKFNFC